MSVGLILSARMVLLFMRAATCVLATASLSAAALSHPTSDPTSAHDPLYHALYHAKPAGALVKSTVNWVSSPTKHGDTVLVNGGGFAEGATVTLTAADGTKTTAKALDVLPTGLKVKLPPMPAGAASDFAAYDISVDGSDSLPVNVPDIWWWQGDGGNFSTPGGWLRVFGRNIAATSTAPTLEQAAKTALDKALAEGDLELAQRHLSTLAAERKSPTQAPTVAQLRMTPKAGSSDGIAAVVLSSVPANTSTFDALFKMPAGFAAGEYTAELSSGLKSAKAGEWFALEMFLSPQVPKLSTVTVQTPKPWPKEVFEVDCDNDQLDIFKKPCGWVGARSSNQVDAALAKARANGGGIVYFPRGQYYIDGPIVVPENTIIRGEGTHLVSIFMREDNPDTAPKPGYVYSDRNSSRWGAEDLSIYISHFYYSVFYVYPACTDFTMQRVRVRGVAWAMLSDPCPHQTGRGNRLANFTRTQVGEIVFLDGNTNYKIIDNDLLATGITIHTGNHGTNSGGPARYGYIARNMIWNANAAHWFDDIKEVIFEWNKILPAGTALSWGNNIDNYSDGYAQHVWHAWNSFSTEWGGDREFMTFDPVIGHFNGHATVDPADAKTYQLGTDNSSHGNADKSSLGGCVSVLQGTGAGQYRRFVSTDAKSSSVTLDAPFATALDETSIMQIGPFKGQLIFHANYYSDGGAFQTYGTAMDVIVSAHRFERTEGLFAWGRSGGGAVYAPNLRIQLLDNVVLEGNHLWNWNATYPYPHPKTIEPYWMGALGSDQDVQPCVPYPHGAKNCKAGSAQGYQGPLNHCVVVRNNKLLNNAGVEVRGHTMNGVVEGNVVTNATIGVHVDTTHAIGIFVTGNTCPKGITPC